MVIIVERVIMVMIVIMVEMVFIVVMVIMVKVVMVVAMAVMVVMVTIIMVVKVVRVFMVIMIIRTDRTTRTHRTDRTDKGISVQDETTLELVSVCLPHLMVSVFSPPLKISISCNVSSPLPVKFPSLVTVFLDKLYNFV